MLYKQLGSTQVEIPAIGQGTAASLYTKPEAIRHGLELGMTLIDTAEWYSNGHSEELVAQATKGIRDKVFIATKVSPMYLSYRNVLKSAKGSLKRLNTDYIDLYQVHWPNPAIPIDETMRAMEKLKKEGKVRFVGVSNFSRGELGEARKRMEIVSNQVEYNLFDRSAEETMMPYCQREGLTIIAHTPLLHGRRISSEKAKVLKSIADRYGKSITQITLNWLVAHPSVVAIPKAANLAHIRENAYATDFQLAEEDFNEISGLFSMEYVYILPERVRVGIEDREDYMTLLEAMRNKRRTMPSPLDLARSIKSGTELKTIRVALTKDTTGKYDYDLIEGGMRYWAHIIASGDAPIKALVRR